MGLFNRKNKEKDGNTTAQIEAAKARVAEMNRAINNSTFDSDKAFKTAMEDDYGLGTSDFDIGIPSFGSSSRTQRNTIPSNRSSREFSSGDKRNIMSDLFSRKYREIEAMRKAMSSDEFFKKQGLDFNHSSKYTDGFYKKIPDGEKKYLFLPYLMEKEASGLLDKKESIELKEMLENIKEEKIDLKTGYVKSLIFLHALGVTNVRDNTVFENTFNVIDTNKFDRESIAQVGDSFGGRETTNDFENSGRGGR